MARLLFLLSLLMAMSVAPAAADLDVFIAYSGKDKAAKKALRQQLPPSLKVKDYNVDLLALADYSGKQKAIARLGRARVLILLHDRAAAILAGASLPADLIIVESAVADIETRGRKIHIASQEVDLSGLEGAVQEAAGVDEVERAAQAAAAIRVAPGVDLFKAAALVAALFAGR